MPKVIMHVNLSSPFNLSVTGPAYGGLEFQHMTEDEILAWVLNRNQEIGLIPCATDEERDAMTTRINAEFEAKHGRTPTLEERPSLPSPAPHYIVERTDLPDGDDDYFCDAWEWDGTQVAVNMPKARVIHMDRIRRVRDKELAKLDVPWMIAVEAGDTATQSTITTQKQTLRNIPATFDLTTDVVTPVQLKARWPSELPARE